MLIASYLLGVLAMSLYANHTVSLALAKAHPVKMLLIIALWPLSLCVFIVLAIIGSKLPPTF